jgi:hypothetical protein
VGYTILTQRVGSTPTALGPGRYDMPPFERTRPRSLSLATPLHLQLLRPSPAVSTGAPATLGPGAYHPHGHPSSQTSTVSSVGPDFARGPARPGSAPVAGHAPMGYVPPQLFDQQRRAFLDQYRNVPVSVSVPVHPASSPKAKDAGTVEEDQDFIFDDDDDGDDSGGTTKASGGINVDNIASMEDACAALACHGGAPPASMSSGRGSQHWLPMTTSALAGRPPSGRAKFGTANPQRGSGSAFPGGAKPGGHRQGPSGRLSTWPEDGGADAKIISDNSPKSDGVSGSAVPANRRRPVSAHVLSAHHNEAVDHSSAYNDTGACAWSCSQSADALSLSAPPVQNDPVKKGAHSGKEPGSGGTGSQARILVWNAGCSGAVVAEVCTGLLVSVCLSRSLQAIVRWPEVGCRSDGVRVCICADRKQPCSAPAVRSATQRWQQRQRASTKDVTASARLVFIVARVLLHRRPQPEP